MIGPTPTIDESPMTRLTAALLSFIALAAPASAWAADAANGERLAERWCATCHIVSAV
jgi:mono/diheme cytochrome c family protein